MKALYLIPLLFGCYVPSRFSNEITPATKMELTTFYLADEKGSEYLAHVVNFIETGDMWILWTKFIPDPEFTPVFKIEHHDIVSTNPYSMRSYPTDLIKDTVAEYFRLAYKNRESGKMKVIKLVE